MTQSYTTTSAEYVQKIIKALSLCNSNMAHELKRMARGPTREAFESVAYWDERHLHQPLGYEWYLDYRALRHVVTNGLPKDTAVLHVGVGTSLIQEHMLDDGYQYITSIDSSATAIKRLSEAHADKPQLAYEVADVCHMPHIPDGSYGGVLDKGTFDCLWCSHKPTQQRQQQQQQQQHTYDHRYIERDDDDDVEDSSEKAMRMLQECCRVLRPGAPLVLVSSGSPYVCMQLLRCEDLQFQSASFYGIATGADSDKVHVVGPYTDVEQGLDAALFEDVNDVLHVDYIYVAVKA